MKIQLQTTLWEKTKEEIIPQIRHIMWLMLIPTTINIIHNILTGNIIMTLINCIAWIIIFIIEQSIKKYEEKQWKKHTSTNK